MKQHGESYKGQTLDLIGILVEQANLLSQLKKLKPHQLGKGGKELLDKGNRK